MANAQQSRRDDEELADRLTEAIATNSSTKDADADREDPGAAEPDREDA